MSSETCIKPSKSRKAILAITTLSRFTRNHKIEQYALNSLYPLDKLKKNSDGVSALMYANYEKHFKQSI